MLANNETKDIKVIRFLENRGILLKGNTGKINSQEGGLLDFLAPLIRAGLPLMKNVLMPLAKSVLIPSNFTIGCMSSKYSCSKKFFGLGMTTLIISSEEMKDIMKIGKP